MSKKPPVDPLKEDFRKFLFLVWKFLNLPEPTTRQYEMASYLQHCPNNRRCIQAFRGMAKSWVCAAYVCWRLYCDPQVNILVVSASAKRADNFTTFCLQLIEGMPLLQHLTPRSEQRSSKLEFDVAPAYPDQNASVVSRGITGQITGSRADEIIFDDVEIIENSATQMMREKLSEKIKEADSILKPAPNGEPMKITYLGTPQTESSIYKDLPSRTYDVRIWPCFYPSEKQREKYGIHLAPGILREMLANPELEGTSTEPTRFTNEDLAARRDSIGPSTFQLQFMLDPALSDANRYPLRLSDLLVMPCDTEVAPERAIWAGIPSNVINDLPNVGLTGDRLYRPAEFKDAKHYPYSQICLIIDPAGRGKDETAWAVGGFLHGFIYLLAAGGMKGYDEPVLEALAKIALRYKAKTVKIEANFGDGMFTKLFTPVLLKVMREANPENPHKCGVEEVKHSTQKERRIIDTIEPVIASHRLVVDIALIESDFRSTEGYDGSGLEKIQYQLFYQLTHITRDRGSLKHDDRIDAVAMLVAHFAQAMGTDPSKAIAKNLEKALDEELKNWNRGILGKKFQPRGKVWVQRA